MENNNSIDQLLLDFYIIIQIRIYNENTNIFNLKIKCTLRLEDVTPDVHISVQTQWHARL